MLSNSRTRYLVKQKLSPIKKQLPGNLAFYSWVWTPIGQAHSRCSYEGGLTTLSFQTSSLPREQDSILGRLRLHQARPILHLRTAPPLPLLVFFFCPHCPGPSEARLLLLQPEETFPSAPSAVLSLVTLHPFLICCNPWPTHPLWVFIWVTHNGLCVKFSNRDLGRD